MDKRSAQIMTVCECIDQCFAFKLWCDDFAQYVDPEDLVMGLDRGFEVVSDATRLHSFLAFRKLDDFIGDVKSGKDDLVASTLGIVGSGVLGNVGKSFLTSEERTDINKELLTSPSASLSMLTVKSISKRSSRDPCRFSRA
jgi:hypothetical protein